MDVRSVSVADVEKRLFRVQDDQHLDPQWFAEARIGVGMRLLSFLIRAHD